MNKTIFLLYKEMTKYIMIIKHGSILKIYMTNLVILRHEFFQGFHVLRKKSSEADYVCNISHVWSFVLYSQLYSAGC